MQERVLTWRRLTKWVTFGFVALLLLLLLVGCLTVLVYTYPYDSLGHVFLGLSFLLSAGLSVWRLGQVYRDRKCRGELVIGEAGLRVRDSRDTLIPWSSVERIRAVDVSLTRIVTVWFAEPEDFDPGPNRFFGPSFQKKKGKRVVGFSLDFYGMSPREFAGELAQRIGLDPTAFAVETLHWRESVRRLAIFSNAAFVGITLVAFVGLGLVFSDDDAPLWPALVYAGMFAVVGLLNLGGLFVRGEDFLPRLLVNVASLWSVVFAWAALIWMVFIVATESEWSRGEWIVSAWGGLFLAACVLTVVALVRFSKIDLTVPGGELTPAAVVSPGSESE